MLDFDALRQRMVDHQLRPSEVTDHALIRAFLTVPRELFVDPAERPFAYGDLEVPMPASPERRMMAPVPLARMIQALPRGDGIRAMIVGCGSGYSAAILERLVGSVVAVEEDPALLAIAKRCRDAVGATKVELVQGKLTEGHPAGAPYDAILIDGAVEFVPQGIIRQLKQGGFLAAIEVDERIGRAILRERIGEDDTGWPLFEAWATLLPGFQRERAFVF
jgi:protein-L-isoaspartate(D-aspartate) O-methyltransferase